MLLYLVATISLLIIIALIYANRKQSRVTATSEAEEPDVDLSQHPTPPSEGLSKQEASLTKLVEQSRDPKMAQMSDKELVMEVLKECYDPEIPLNIVDLGLIYEVEPTDQITNVKMSLTAPGCPSSESISSDIQSKLEAAGFPTPKVEIVWDPPWTAQRISEEGKKTLGL